MLNGSSVFAAVFVLLLCGVLGGSDCAPGLGVGEAADCCACLGDHGADGLDAAPGGNCLPDDISQGFDRKVEVQQCAADAADGIAGGNSKVTADVDCREGDHPCAALCAKAADEGVVFAD